MSSEQTLSSQEQIITSPNRYCDIVMKGGITSGVIYPPAVVELANTFTFKNVGGTSAGAIAAALTAAAEYGRKSPQGGFKKLKDLPEELGSSVSPSGDSLLFSLFRPQKRTRPLFRILVAGIGNKGLKPVRIALTAIVNFLGWAAVGIVPGFLLGYLAICSARGVLLWWSLVCALLLIVAGAVSMVAVGLYRAVTNAIPANDFGLCRGLMEDASHVPVLTPWLTDLINETAGLTRGGSPLTFGDLWGQQGEDEEGKINLQMMTTNLTTGRPHRLPFKEHIFFFDPEEWKKFFPESVMKLLLEKSSAAETDKYAPLRKLPSARDLPVVVATRLSLSFPFLLSAVPLYAIDFGRKDAEDRKPEKCWFSDGGICSNFPVHFFDSPLPRWPTFAINLRGFHPDHPDPVFMPDKNLGGITETFTQFDVGNGRQRLTGFVAAIIDTLRNWNDNMQTHLPGYRDRIVHVSLNKTEGGINLNMPAELIIDLGRRGKKAAILLTQHFTRPADQAELSWDNHRWVRYRSLMALLEGMFERIRFSVNNPIPPDRTYLNLIDRKENEAPNSYRWVNKRQHEFAHNATLRVLDLAETWLHSRDADSFATFGKNEPKPEPELRVRPRI